jgi:hypothetical protein
MGLDLDRLLVVFGLVGVLVWIRGSGAAVRYFAHISSKRPVKYRVPPRLL